MLARAYDLAICSSDQIAGDADAVRRWAVRKLCESLPRLRYPCDPASTSVQSSGIARNARTSAA